MRAFLSAAVRRFSRISISTRSPATASATADRASHRPASTPAAMTALRAGLALPLLWVASANAATIPARDYFTIPRAAFTNELGNFPDYGPCSIHFTGESHCTGRETLLPAQFSGGNPPVQPGLGVPLGGVGAGAFMINQANTFGPWNFGGRQEIDYENRILPQAAFHVREQLVGEVPTVRTLAINRPITPADIGPWSGVGGPWGGVLPAWSTLQKGDGTYSALWPFGWTTYKTFQADVSMRFWSPIVAGEERRTSMPVAFFDVRVANHTAKANTLTVMFTMPNASHHIGAPRQYPVRPLNPATVREGLSSRVSRNRTTGVWGVSLSASSPNNTADARDTEWTIAAKPAPGQSVSYTSSWNAAGDGSDVYAPFALAGRLPNQPLDSSASAGAIAVTVTLQPGETTVIPFALAWDFPQVTAPSWELGQSHMRRYTSYFGGRQTERNDYIKGSYPFFQGFKIANAMLSEHDASLAAVERWVYRIVNEPAYPDWLVREALNELPMMVWNTSFWESGLITDTPSPATHVGSAIPNTHVFCFMTGGGYTGCNLWDVDAQGYTAESLLFPFLERDRLLAVLQEELQDVPGFCCEAFNPLNGPTRSYREDIGEPQFKDVPMKTIFRSWAHFRQSKRKDLEFFRYAYPVMVKLTRILQAGILPGDHFPMDYPGQAQTYDVMEVVGHGIYNSGLWLLTQEIMIEATREAIRLGLPEADPAFLAALEAELPLAKNEFELLFWDPATSHYKFDASGYSHSNGYFVDFAYGQHIATTLGLPPFMNDERLVTHMIQAFPQFMQLRDETGHFIGPPNMAPLVGPILPFTTFYARPEDDLVWTGSAMTMAATYISEGKRLKNRALVGMGLEIAHAIEYQMIERFERGYMFNYPEYWPNIDSNTYAYSGGNRFRVGMDILNSLKPVRPIVFRNP